MTEDEAARKVAEPTIDEWWDDIRVVGLTAASRACTERAIRAHERARIVAWLRALDGANPEWVAIVRDIAEMIEEGEAA